MEKLEKGLTILMWGAVVLLVIIFFVTIAVGFATDYDFIYSFQNVNELNQGIAAGNNVIL